MPELRPVTSAAEPQLLAVFGHSLHPSANSQESPRSGTPRRAWGTAPKSAPPHFSRKRNAVPGFSPRSVTQSMRAASARPVSSSGSQHAARLSIDDLYHVAEKTRVRASTESRDQMLAKKQKTAATPSPPTRHSVEMGTAAHGFVTEVTVTPHASLVVHPRYTFLFSGSAGVGARRSVSSAKPAAAVSDSSSSSGGDTKRARSALSVSAGDKHSYDEAGSRSLNVSRQCCEVMGPGVCWECSKLRVRLTERARMEADFPRMRVSQQNVTTSALVTRMLPGMSPGEIQDRIVRGEIAKSGLVFPRRLNAEVETVHRQNDIECGHRELHGNNLKSDASAAGDNSATKRAAREGLPSPTTAHGDDDDEGVDEWHSDGKETPDMKVILAVRSTQDEHHDHSFTEADDSRNGPHLSTPSGQSPHDRDDFIPSHLIPGVRSHSIINNNNSSYNSFDDKSNNNHPNNNSSSNKEQHTSCKHNSHSGNDKDDDSNSSSNNSNTRDPSPIHPGGEKSAFGSVLMLAKLKLRTGAGGEPSTPLYFMDLRHMNAKILQGRAARVAKPPPSARARTPASARDATRDRLGRLGLLPSNDGRQAEDGLGVGSQGEQLPVFVSPRKAQVTLSGSSFKGFFDPPLLSRQQQASAVSFFAGSDDTFSVSERLSPVSVMAAEVRRTKSSGTRITKPGHRRQRSPLPGNSLMLANRNAVIPVPKVEPVGASRTDERPYSSVKIDCGKDADTTSTVN